MAAKRDKKKKKSLSSSPSSSSFERKKKKEPNTLWSSSVPDLILEKIFTLLTIPDRHVASQVCSNWYRIFHSSIIWSKMVIDDRTLTRRKYNYYLGYEHQLDHYRAQLWLNRVGRNLQILIFKPMSNYFNLYEMMKMLTQFAIFYDENPLDKIHTFDFTFGVEKEKQAIFGTGGTLLRQLKQLLENLPGLERLYLRELLLEENEAHTLFDGIVQIFCETLLILKVINCTKLPFSWIHLGCFVNLQELIITPQHLNDEVILMLSSTKLRHLWIVYTKYTENECTVSKYAWKQWNREARTKSHALNVHLMITGNIKKALNWQINTHVKSIIFDCCYISSNSASILETLSLYSSSLEIYGYYGLPKYKSAKSFHDRNDIHWVTLVTSCPNLKTLLLRERISTCTLLLIASSTTSLTNLYVRRKAIIKRCDWPKDPSWSNEFYNWLKISSRSYDLTFKEVARLLNKNWSPLSDRQYKMLHPPQTA